MSDTMASLRRQRAIAGDFQSVVRTMKVMAAFGIGQYEQSVRALSESYRTIELGLGACIRAMPKTFHQEFFTAPHDTEAIGVVVFGSDQGLVGQFNDIMADMNADVQGDFHRLRQSEIDEELFDVVSGFESLTELQGR